MDSLQHYLENDDEDTEIEDHPFASYHISQTTNNPALKKKTEGNSAFWRRIETTVFHQAALGKITLYAFDEEAAHWIPIPANYFFFDLVFDLPLCRIKPCMVGTRAFMVSPDFPQTEALLELGKTGKIRKSWDAVLVSKSQLLALWPDGIHPSVGQIKAQKAYQEQENKKKRCYRQDEVEDALKKLYPKGKYPLSCSKKLHNQLRENGVIADHDTILKVLKKLNGKEKAGETG